MAGDAPTGLLGDALSAFGVNVDPRVQSLMGLGGSLAGQAGAFLTQGGGGLAIEQERQRRAREALRQRKETQGYIKQVSQTFGLDPKTFEAELATGTLPQFNMPTSQGYGYADPAGQFHPLTMGQEAVMPVPKGQAARPLIPAAGAQGMYNPATGKWDEIPPDMRTPQTEPKGPAPQRPHFDAGSGMWIHPPNSVTGQVPPPDKVPGFTPAGERPTAATKTMAETARKVKKLAAEVDSLVDENVTQLGPKSGRVSEFLTGRIGMDNPKFNRLRVAAKLLTTLTLRMHMGARGGIGMLNEFKTMFALNQSPDNLRASLAEVAAYADSLMEGVPGLGASGEQAPQGSRPMGATHWSPTRGFTDADGNPVQ